MFCDGCLWWVKSYHGTWPLDPPRKVLCTPDRSCHQNLVCTHTVLWPTAKATTHNRSVLQNIIRPSLFSYKTFSACFKAFISHLDTIGLCSLVALASLGKIQFSYPTVYSETSFLRWSAASKHRNPNVCVWVEVLYSVLYMHACVFQ